MTLKQKYNKAKFRYLNNLKALEKEGYIIDPIELPKKPTQKLVNELNKLTPSRLRGMATLVNIVTGEILGANEKGRKELVKSNKRFFNLSPFEQENSLRTKKIYVDKTQRDYIPELSSLPNNVDIVIQNWFETIEDFRGDVRDLVRDRTNELINNRENGRVLFAYSLINNRESLPDPTIYDDQIINRIFNEFATVMEWNRNSLEFEKFVDMFGVVESE